MTFKLREFTGLKRKRDVISREITIIEGVYIELVRKHVRNIGISIRPPDGNVRVTAPVRVEFEIIRRFVSSKIEWIRKHSSRIKERPSEPEKFYVSGERHLLFGRSLELIVNESIVTNKTIADEYRIIINVLSGSAIHERKAVLESFYRKELRKLIPQMISRWEIMMRVEVMHFGIRAMKTRWGTCNINARRIWLNLELAKKPVECLEYIVVHEMVHLLERNHTKRFHRLMDTFLPDWRERKKLLEQGNFPH